MFVCFSMGKKRIPLSFCWTKQGFRSHTLWSNRNTNLKLQYYFSWRDLRDFFLFIPHYYGIMENHVWSILKTLCSFNQQMSSGIAAAPRRQCLSTSCDALTTFRSSHSRHCPFRSVLGSPAFLADLSINLNFHPLVLICPSVGPKTQAFSSSTY